MRTFESKQSQIPWPGFPHIMQYIDLSLGNWFSRFCNCLTNFNSKHLNHSAKSSMFNCMARSGFSGTHSSPFGSFTFPFNFTLFPFFFLAFPFIPNSLSDDSNSSSSDKLSESESVSSSGLSSDSACHQLFPCKLTGLSFCLLPQG